MSDSLPETDAEWRARLTPDQYRICRQKGTEPAFTGAYWDEKTPGLYRCAGCGEVLFDSATKYDSGSGWPSFWQPAQETVVAEEVDTSHGMRRVEVRSKHADSHLGHVFPDGPRSAGGLRYCINSASLRFVPVAQLAAEGYAEYLPLFGAAGEATHG